MFETCAFNHSANLPNQLSLFLKRAPEGREIFKKSGRSGIRTLVPKTRKHVLQTCAFDHSANLPKQLTAPPIPTKSGRTTSPSREEFSPLPGGVARQRLEGAVKAAIHQILKAYLIMLTNYLDLLIIDLLFFQRLLPEP